jgi:sulfur carrier protein
LYSRFPRVTSRARFGGDMRLLLNGEERDIAGISSIADLVSALGLDARKVAVERNLEIAPRSTYADTALADGDRIEIVTFIGGG